MKTTIPGIKQNSIKDLFLVILNSLYNKTLLFDYLNLYCFHFYFLVYFGIFLYIQSFRFSSLYFLFYLIFKNFKKCFKIKLMIVAILAYWFWLCERILEFSGCWLGNQGLGRFVFTIGSNRRA